MGFWHTGYMEFHEPTGGGASFSSVPPPPTYPCETCGLSFSSEGELRVHAFQGHVVPRPILLLKGRECGRSRLMVTAQTTPADWVFHNARTIAVNGRVTSVGKARALLASQRSGVTEVTIANGGWSEIREFEFSLAEEEDLNGVDAALERLVDGGELSLRAIDDFIMRSKRYPTASGYLAGLAHYLYGVLTREGASEAGFIVSSLDMSYEARYDRAVTSLSRFDRAPAEAICGLVAFHYNQFKRAMSKTRSQRVSRVSLRFQALTTGRPHSSDDLTLSPHASLDFALSDSIIEQVLEWSALPLDGSAGAHVSELVWTLDQQRPYDAFKLRMIAAEHYLTAGDLPAAAKHAEALRHGRNADGWYLDFHRRLREGSAE